MRLTPLLTAAVLVAAPLAAIAPPASAAACTTPTVHVEVAPRTVVVDTTGTAGFDVQVAVEHHGCAIGEVQALVVSPTQGSALLSLSAEAGNATTTYYYAGLDLSASQLDDADAGTWKVRTGTVWAQDAAELETGGQVVEKSGKVFVLADADLSAHARSAALKKGTISRGKALTVAGTLTHARWEKGTSTGYAKQRVELQFRTTKGTYKKVKTVPTRSGGTFSTSVKATKDGCYRVVFAGSKGVAPVAGKGACIDVR